MRQVVVWLTVLVATSFLAYASAKQTSIKVELKDAQGKSVGSATLSSSGKGVKIRLQLQNLPPGEHAIHIHEVPKCEGPGFESAGAHFNPNGKADDMKTDPSGNSGDRIACGVIAK